MTSKSLILDLLNKTFANIQNKCIYLLENSSFLKNIDTFIFISIIAVFIFSTFSSSDLIGYISLITLFLTVIKLFAKKGERIDWNLFEIFLILYFLFVVLSLAGSSLFYLSFKGFLKTFTYLGFYFSTVQYFKNNLSKIPLTILIIALCTSSQGFIGMLQNFAHLDEISTWQDVSNINPEDVMTRVYGTLRPYNPNLFGGYLLASLSSLFGSFIINLSDKKYKTASILLIFSLITSLSLILSGCRGAYLGFFILILSFLGFLAKFIWKDLENKKEFFKKLYLSVLGMIISLSTCIILFVSSIRTRIISIFAMRADSSTSFRFNVYHSSIQMLKDNWLFGIGIGNQNFREIYGLYMKTGFDALSAYSVFLEIAVESGIFSLIAFLAFLITLIYKSIKFIMAEKDFKLSIIVFTAMTSIIVIMVHGLVDTIFFRPQVQFIFWIMAAIISSVLYSKNYNGCKSEECENYYK
jgi:putative inorganic carbon (HCO3(-)) transporter